MTDLVRSLALALLGLMVTAALVAGIVARASLIDQTGSDGHILIIECLGLAAGLALILWGLMNMLITMRNRPQG